MFFLCGRKRPSSVQASLTERCNLRCVHCDIWKKKTGPELSFGQWAQLLLKIKKWLGPFRLDISGGEPFMRQDALQVIEFCVSNGIRTVVTTNAVLIGDELVARLSGIEGLTLNISLDGAQPATHDYLRGAGNTHQRVMHVLEGFRASKKKCHLTLATILMGKNAPEIMRILDLMRVDDLADGINFQALDNNFNASPSAHWQEENPLWPRDGQKEALRALIDELISLKEKGTAIYNPVAQLRHFKEYFGQAGWRRLPVCASGDSNFIIRPDGQALLCWNLEPVGDCLKEAPEKIWRSSQAARRRKEIKRCARSCRILNCNFNIEP